MSGVVKWVTTMVALTLSGCASTFISSWKAPDATLLEVSGAKVVAVAMMKDETSRRIAEDSLAREISAHGAQGVALYALLPGANAANEAVTREALAKAGVQGVVVVRPINVEKEVEITPITMFEPAYRGFWGGYYNYGWGAPWVRPVTVGTDVRTKTVVYVETLVYSLVQNKLVWSGQSKTTNPPGVDKFVKKLATAAAAELDKQGLIKH